MDQFSEAHPHHEILSRIRDEWDQAEADIKLAEQVCLEVIIPSVNELRYAGRRVVDAIAVSREPNASSKIEALYNDSRFFCQRARHDAIDAAVAYMVSNIEEMLVTIGPAIIMQCFSDLPTLRLGLNKVLQNIVASRKDRENRAQIYKTIAECDFAALVEEHTKLALSEALMVQIAEQQRKNAEEESRKARRDRRFGLWGIAFGIVSTIGFVVTLLAWKYPHLLGG